MDDIARILITAIGFILIIIGAVFVYFAKPISAKLFKNANSGDDAAANYNGNDNENASANSNAEMDTNSDAGYNAGVIDANTGVDMDIDADAVTGAVTDAGTEINEGTRINVNTEVEMEIEMEGYPGKNAMKIKLTGALIMIPGIIIILILFK